MEVKYLPTNTPNYNLTIPGANDTVDIVSLEQTNMTIIDAQMYANAQAAAAAVQQSALGETVATLVGGQVPESQLGNVPPVNVATTTQAGTVLVSAAPTSGNPVAVSTTDPAYEAINEGNYVESFNERTGAVTLNGSDVTTALGFTPANAATTPTEGANTFTGNQTAPAFVASGLTGATAGSRHVGGTTGGAPTSGTWNPADFATDQNGNAYVYAQAKSASGSASLTATTNNSLTSGNSYYLTLTATQPTTISQVSCFMQSSGGAMEAAIFNSSGTNLSGWSSGVGMATGAFTTMSLPTAVTLQPGNTYYVGLYVNDACTVGMQQNTLLSLPLSSTLTLGTDITEGSGTTFSTSTILENAGLSLTLGFTYTVNIPAQWVKPNPIGSMGIEFEVANLMNGYDLYSAVTSASNPTTTTGIYNQAGSSSSNNPSHQPTPLIQNVNSNAEYCFEAEINNGTSSGSYTAYAGLWDLTANALVAGSTISTTIYSNAQGQTLRSGAITLIPGHQYAVTVWSSSSSSNSTVYSARIVGQM